ARREGDEGLPRTAGRDRERSPLPRRLGCARLHLRPRHCLHSGLTRPARPPRSAPVPISNRIAEFHREMTEWRRTLHRHPETAFEEVWTSNFVAKKLESFGIEVHRGIAKTGIVGVLRGQGESDRSVGLRADMDALDIKEANE